jgi:hypothetical protein
MGADKNSSQRTNSAYVPNPTSSTRTQERNTRAHNKPTSPRDKPRTKEWKHNSRIKALSLICEAWDGLSTLQEKHRLVAQKRSFLVINHD